MKKSYSIYKAVFLAFLSFSLFMPLTADAGSNDTADAVVAEDTGSDSGNSAVSEDNSGKKSNKKAKKTKEEKQAEKEAAKAAKAAEKAEKDAAKKAAAESKKAAGKKTEDTKPAAEETSKNAKPVKVKDSEEFGIIRLKTKSKYGSYTLGVIKGNGKTTPVLSSADEYTANGYYLRVGRKIYSLCTDGAVKASLTSKTGGVIFKYDIPNTAEVNADYTFFSSQKNNAVDMLKVIVTVANNGKRNEEFAFKAILDTVLGEKTGNHFFTSDGISVKNEVMYRTLQNQKYFISKNDSAALQMFFSGADCTEPAVLAFANKASFSKDKWEPSLLVDKTFDTVFSYNDSAVCSVWKGIKLAPGEKYKVVYYLAFATEGSLPTGEAFIYGKNPKAQADAASGASRAVEVISPYAEDNQGYVDDFVPVITENNTSSFVPYTPVTPNPVTPAPAVQNEYAPVTPDVELNIKNMSREQLTPEYIQALLDRIAALEEDSPTLNRQELLQLNAELDAILNYLRQ